MGIKTRLFDKGLTEECWLHTGAFLLLLVTLPFILQSLLFLVGVPLGPWLFPAVFIALSVYYVRFLYQQQIAAGFVLLWYLLLVGSLLITFEVCVRVYDFSYDGMWYHQDAVRLMVEGWNPYHHFLSLAETGRSDLYVNHYPKAAWTSEAAVYAFTHRIESGKIINWLCWYAAFCFTMYTLRKVLSFSRMLSVAVALVMVANPVVLYQLFSFYVDGILANLILCLVAFVLLRNKGILPLKSFLLILSCTLFFLINTKFTGLIYVCVFTVVFWVYEWMQVKRAAIKSVGYVGCMIALGVMLFGYPAYVNNTLTKGHPLYPIRGEGNVGEAIINVPMPADFLGKNRFEQFNRAMFAKPVWSRNPESSQPRPLFSYDGISHYDEYKRADPEMAGFGPLFGEVLCLLAGGLLVLLIGKRRVFTLPVLAVMVALTASIVVMPAFWYARYAPQIWLLASVGMLLLFRTQLTAWLGYVVLLLLLLNSYLVAHQNWQTQVIRTHELNAFFDSLKSKPTIPRVFDGWTGSFRIKLKENNVRYTLVPMGGFPADSVDYFPNAWMCGAYVVKQP